MKKGIIVLVAVLATALFAFTANTVSAHSVEKGIVIRGTNLEVKHVNELRQVLTTTTTTTTTVTTGGTTTTTTTTITTTTVVDM